MTGRPLDTDGNNYLLDEDAVTSIATGMMLFYILTILYTLILYSQCFNDK
ncbi:MAG: hypothetical protein IPG78_15045 [Ignavibacteria bacterium]|nr:hypothetical protein [Ignavibacteria bacterium]